MDFTNARKIEGAHARARSFLIYTARYMLSAFSRHRFQNASTCVFMPTTLYQQSLVVSSCCQYILHTVARKRLHGSEWCC